MPHLMQDKVCRNAILFYGQIWKRSRRDLHFEELISFPTRTHRQPESFPSYPTPSCILRLCLGIPVYYCPLQFILNSLLMSLPHVNIVDEFSFFTSTKWSIKRILLLVSSGPVLLSCLVFPASYHGPAHASCAWSQSLTFQRRVEHPQTRGNPLDDETQKIWWGWRERRWHETFVGHAVPSLLLCLDALWWKARSRHICLSIK